MTRIVSRLALVGLAIAAVGTAQAEIIGVRLKLGYYFGSSFDLRTGGTGHLNGPDLGVDVPLSNIAGFGIYASPSVMMGGALSHGGDTDGNIYRFMVSARKSINLTGVYGQVAVGVGHTEPRSGVNAFRGDNGFITSFTVGTPIAISFIPGIHPNLEGTYYHSSASQLRGFTIGLSASF